MLVQWAGRERSEESEGSGTSYCLMVIELLKSMRFFCDMRVSATVMSHILLALLDTGLEGL